MIPVPSERGFQGACDEKEIMWFGGLVAKLLLEQDWIEMGRCTPVRQRLGYISTMAEPTSKWLARLELYDFILFFRGKKWRVYTSNRLLPVHPYTLKDWIKNGWHESHLNWCTPMYTEHVIMQCHRPTRARVAMWQWQWRDIYKKWNL